jgi:hypothetical protein
MITVLSLVVAILAVFVGPSVARTNVQRQIRATAKENWMREFRQQAVALICAHAALRDHSRASTAKASARAALDPNYVGTSGVLEQENKKRLGELSDALNPPYQAIRLLIAEKGADGTELRNNTMCGHRVIAVGSLLPP